MSLMKTLRGMWQSDTALSASLGVERLTTGFCADAVLPYAVILPGKSKELLQTNSGNDFQRVIVEIQSASENLDHAEEVQEHLRRVFSGVVLDMNQADVTYRLRCGEYHVAQDDDGVWRGFVSISCMKCACEQ